MELLENTLAWSAKPGYRQLVRSLAKIPGLGLSFLVEHRNSLAWLEENIEENTIHFACLRMPVSISRVRSVTEPTTHLK